MIVAEKGSQRVGFMLCLEQSPKNIVNDLVAVTQHYRGRGIASCLIAFAENLYQNASKISVGTQVINVASIHAYEKMGFFFAKADYVFHFHGDSEAS